MTWLLDHLFVLVAPGAPVADELVQAGFREGSGNTHPGQGTANRRFFFEDAMLELLWVHDADEAQAPGIARLGLAERAAGGCPFGLCLRPGAGAGPLPFEAFSYRPPYLPPDLEILVATSADRVAEPLIFALPWGRAPSEAPPDRREPTAHENGARVVRGVEVESAIEVGAWSAPLRALGALDRISVRAGARDLMRVEVGLAAPVDLRPACPLVLA